MTSEFLDMSIHHLLTKTKSNWKKVGIEFLNILFRTDGNDKRVVLNEQRVHVKPTLKQFFQFQCYYYAIMLMIKLLKNF